MIRRLTATLAAVMTLILWITGAVVTGGVMVIWLCITGLAALIWFGGVSGVFPDSNTRALADRQALQARQAAVWTNACATVDCSTIPLGQVLGRVGTAKFLLPMPEWQTADLALPAPATTDPGGCHVTTHMVRGIQYQDGIAQRGIDPGGANLPLRITCPQTQVRTSLWPREGGTGYVRYDTGHLWADPPSFNVRHDAYLPGRSWAPPEVTYASRAALLRPAGGGFDVFVGQDEMHTGLYLSRDPLFQGRHVALVCRHDCAIRTVAFQDDPPLDTAHLEFLVQFTPQGLDCAPYQPVWTCGVLPAALPDIASLIAFLDRQVTQARR